MKLVCTHTGVQKWPRSGARFAFGPWTNFNQCLWIPASGACQEWNVKQGNSGPGMYAGGGGGGGGLGVQKPTPPAFRSGGEKKNYMEI